VDLVLVIGSKNSSNSQRLVDTATRAGKPATSSTTCASCGPEWLERHAGVW
jgi:4-hydroxy-3-methylbut-2-enyl diphosphate reductase IspH